MEKNLAKFQNAVQSEQGFLGLHRIGPRPVKMRSKDAALKGIERKDCSTRKKIAMRKIRNQTVAILPFRKCYHGGKKR